jgi:hypothetical protein
VHQTVKELKLISVWLLAQILGKLAFAFSRRKDKDTLLDDNRKLDLEVNIYILYLLQFI